MIPGRFTIGLCDVAVAVPQGFDQAGLAGAVAGLPAERAMLRPERLKGRALVIDPASGLSAALSTRFRETVFRDVASERLGVVIASRYGSAAALKTFADRVRRGSSAPAAFAASGYNASAGFSAMAADAHGPSLAIAGHGACLRLAVQRAWLYIARGDADAMIVIAGESHPDGTDALAVGVAIKHPEAAPMIVDDADFALPAETDRPPAGPFSRFPWLWPGRRGLFAACTGEMMEAPNAG